MAVKRSELKKAKNPKNEPTVLYYTEVDFNFDNNKITVPMKITTGSEITIIGINNPALDSIRDTILKLPTCKIERDVYGKLICLRSYKVTDIKLTNKITLTDKEIFFSEELGSNAILAMDILGNYNLEYINNRFYLSE